MPNSALNRAQSRDLDRRAIEDFGVIGLVLMENAGRGCVDVLEKLGIDGTVIVLCGKGNNAGDGFVIARHLAVRGHTCRTVLLSPPAEMRGDAATNLAIVSKLNLPLVDLSGAPQVQSELMRALDEHGENASWIVDAMLGTGAQGEPRAPFDTAIDWINSRRGPARVLAVDVPSGLDCDTGQPAAHTVRADHTCTFAAMKAGFLHDSAKPFTGAVHICDIGVPRSLIDQAVRS